MLLWLHTLSERDREQLEAVNSSGCGCTNTTNFHLPFAVVSRLQFRHTRTRWMWSFRHVHTKNRAHEVVLSLCCHLNFLVFSFIFVNVATFIQYMDCYFVFGLSCEKVMGRFGLEKIWCGSWAQFDFESDAAHYRTNHVRRQQCKRSDIVPISRLIHNYQKLANTMWLEANISVFCVLRLTLTPNYNERGPQRGTCPHKFICNALARRHSWTF